ncbi:unnamed protein product [Prunus armeniaca]|uniref:Uncharacterized protein n=1 Tax=Prunus armeniaca TaxID=36596 RepID=A0A6J5UTD1_PRUAR|nr:unnamed protein product [Prunus armeniaca]
MDKQPSDLTGWDRKTRKSRTFILLSYGDCLPSLALVVERAVEAHLYRIRRNLKQLVLPPWNVIAVGGFEQAIKN